MKKSVTVKKSSTQKKADRKSWHKKIAASRAMNPEWRKNLAIGKMNAALNPSELRIARMKMKLHQDVIAKKLEMSKSTYGNIELGKQLVKKPLAIEIARVIGKPVNKLFAASSVDGKLKVVFNSK